MPELPEVETIVQGLRMHILGRTVAHPTLLMPEILHTAEQEFARRVRGRTVRDVRRRGKLIVIELSGGWSLIIHLKMTGRLVWVPEAHLPEKHTHLVFCFTRCPYQLRYCDERRFGYVILVPTDRQFSVPPLKDLGPEPLEIAETDFVEHLAGRTGRMKSLLLNQRFLAGIGNIYSDESLWRARIHPLTQANRLSARKGRDLHRAIQEVLVEAIEHRGSSVDTYRDARDQPGEFQFRLQVYGREGSPCLRCGRTIRRVTIGGRSSCFCPRCQRRK